MGEPEAVLELEAGANTPAIVEALIKTYPQLATMLPRCALALNGEYVQGAALVAEGDEVAVLPPMSGG